MAGARLVFSIGGTTTELSSAVTSARQMLGDLARTAAKPADPGRSSGIKASIDEQRKQLALMKGTYDEVTAKAIEFRRKGAPQELISQYVALRREILATAAAEKAAADQAAARAAQNAAYIASQERLATARSAARSAAMNPTRAGGRGGMGGGGAMMLPLMANSLAVGFQDAVSAYQVTGNALSAISAAGNNLIFLMTLLNPMAGALGAVAIGLTQLGIAWLSSGDNAESSAKKQEEATKRVNDALQAQIDIRNKLAEGDVKGVDEGVNNLSRDLKAKEREVAFLDKTLDKEYEKPEASRDYNKIEAAEERKRQAHNEINALRAQLADAKEVQAKITPWDRKVQDAKDGKFDAPLSELQRMRDETARLTGQETELQQKQREWKKQGLSPNTVNDLSAAFEANKAAKEAEAEKKKNEAAEATKKREDEAAETKRKAEADRVREETRTPWEKWRDEGQRLRGMFDNGEIDADTFGRGVKKATKDRNAELMKDIPDRVSHAQSLVRGSVEAARVATTGRRDEKLETIAQQQLAEQKATRQAIERSYRNPLKRPALKEGK